MKHAIDWFEIPVSDFDRAKKFYEHIFQITLQEMVVGPKLGLFPVDTDGIGGAIAHGKGYVPSVDGTKIYLRVEGKMQDVLDRVESAGGKIVVPCTQISEMFGYMGAFTDTEGNWIGVHSKA